MVCFAMPLQRLVSRFALALLLVFTQQQAVLHLLGHGLEQLAAKKLPAGPAEQACEKCLAFAQVDHAAAPVVAPARFDTSAIEARPVALLAVRASRFAPAYRSRAPPLLG